MIRFKPVDLPEPQSRGEAEPQEIHYVINRNKPLEAGQRIILFPEGICEVVKVDSCGAMILPEPRTKRFHAWKSRTPGIESKDEKEIEIKARARAFYIAANSEVPVITN